MAKLAREDEVFIVDEKVDRGCSCTTFHHAEMYTRGKISVCRCALEKEGSCKILFIFNLCGYH